MTFSALSSRANEVGVRLFGLDLWSGAVQQEGSQNEGKGNHNRQKHRSKGH
jgi:hypothetical protein